MCGLRIYAYTEKYTPLRKNLCQKGGGTYYFVQGNQYAVGKEVLGGATLKYSDPALDLIWSRERWGKDFAN